MTDERAPDFPLNIDSDVMSPFGDPVPPPSPVPPGLPLDQAATLRTKAGESLGSDLPFLPGYEMLERIGRGGMGVVYRARQINLNRVVAVKMIDPRSFTSADHLQRFQSEAKAVAQLQHPGIVQIYEVGTFQAPDGLAYPYMALEYVGGGTLSRRIGGQPQRPKDAARLVLQLAEAVDHAHQQGVIHRDLNPANVLLDDKRKGRMTGSDVHPALRMINTMLATPKVADFGVAKNFAGGPQDQTKSGMIVGTPSYMAPEQAEGKSKLIGPSTDVYALGAILYEMLTGRPPFQGVQPMDVILQVLAEDPIAPRVLQPKIPEDLESICLKCLQKDQAARYPSAAALAQDLAHFINDEPVEARGIGGLQRVLRWMRRHPQATVVLGLWHLALASVIAFLAWEWHQADQTAQQLRKEINQMRLEK
ncbi:MAG TPA: serine/threonine-protein kinase [Gemmatales bacterium]|nr:serine/threonine-protein kinase [Gemmatales bacterium]HMP60699.1 serine/threonine-protein kinase [Gemmatales bacterium]